MDDSGVCLDRSVRIKHSGDSYMTTLASPMFHQTSSSSNETPIKRNTVRRPSSCSPGIPPKKRRVSKPLTYHSLLPHSPPSLTSHVSLALSLAEPLVKLDTDVLSGDCDQVDPGFLQYELDTYLHRRSIEMRYHPIQCLKNQSEVTSTMREMMVQWIIQINEQFTFTDTTLFLAVNCLDRFLKITPIARDIFQLTCVTSLLIAAKQEEQYPPEIASLIELCKNNYTREQVIQLERIILRKLMFEMLAPTANYFLEHFTTQRMRTARITVTLSQERVKLSRDLAGCLLKRCLVDYELSQYAPSLLALCSLEASDKLLRQCTRLGPLDTEGHSISEINVCVLKLHRMALIHRICELKEGRVEEVL